MPELVSIALGQFVKFGLVFALLYGLYRLVRFLVSRIPDDFFGKRKEETWDGVQLLYSVPSSIFGFLALAYVVICLSSGIAEGGFRGFFGSSNWNAFGMLIYGLDNPLGIIGCGGIFASIIFGIYQDYPPTRLKILGVIALFAALVGIGFRFH